MASVQQHIDQWKHNRLLLTQLPPDFPDWVVTVAFYTALHAVDSLLGKDGEWDITSHDDRNRILCRINRYKAVRVSYMQLYDLSRTVRYLANPAAWVPADQLYKNVVARLLCPVEKSVQHLMGLDLGLPRIELQPAEPVEPLSSETESARPDAEPSGPPPSGGLGPS